MFQGTTWLASATWVDMSRLTERSFGVLNLMACTVQATPTPRPSHAHATQATPTPRPSNAHAQAAPKPRPCHAHAMPTPHSGPSRTWWTVGSRPLEWIRRNDFECTCDTNQGMLISLRGHVAELCFFLHGLPFGLLHFECFYLVMISFQEGEAQRWRHFEGVPCRPTISSTCHHSWRFVWTGPVRWDEDSACGHGCQVLRAKEPFHLRASYSCQKII